MRRCFGKFRFAWGLVILLYGLPSLLWGAGKPYKIYVINKYGAYDIVCDSYTVKEDDHIWDILRRKGSIADEDFPRFVEILKKLNPGIKDVNKIVPNQKILIPLKQLSAKEPPQPVAGPRFVTIPMLPDILHKRHLVQEGDCLSKIVTAHLGLDWRQVPTRYFEALKRLNPRIKNLNVIYAGETLRLPDLRKLEAPVPVDEDSHVTMTAAMDGEPVKEPQIAPPVPATPVDVPEPPQKEQAVEGQVGQKEISPPVLETFSSEEKDEPAEDIEMELPDTVKIASVKPVDRLEEAPESHQQKKSEPVPAVEKNTSGQDKKDTVTSQDATKEGGGGKGEKDIGPSSREKRPQEAIAGVYPPVVTRKPAWQDVVSRVMRGIGGKLMASGLCSFPGSEGKEVTLDLAAFPIAELRNGRHLLLESDGPLPEQVRQVVRTSWQGLQIVPADSDVTAATVLDRMFSSFFGNTVRRTLTLSPFPDGVQATLRANWIFFQKDQDEGGVGHYAVTLLKNPEEGTPGAVKAYLEKHQVFVVDVPAEEGAPVGMTPAMTVQTAAEKSTPAMIHGRSRDAFVAGIARALGFHYEPQVPVFFDYAGFQVQTTGNLIYGGEGMDVVVDFGTFYGDTKSAIEAGGMRVLSITEEDGAEEITRSLLSALGAPYTESPVFYVAQRNLSTNSALALPGYLISYGDEKKALLSDKTPASEILAFLSHEKIGAIVASGSWGSKKIYHQRIEEGRGSQ